jgi:putative transcriptional regulator
MKNVELTEETTSILRRAGCRVEIISYPPENRGIDIVAYRDIGKPLVIKVSEDLEEVSKAELEDLEKSGKAYSAVSLLIALRRGSSELEDDIIYEKRGVFAITVRTLEKYLTKNEKPIVIYSRGGYYLKIDSKVFREKLREYGYTRGELAELLKVTKKTIYLYERGELLVPVDKGLILAELIGEDIFEDLDFANQQGIMYSEEITSDTPRDEIEEVLWELASKLNKLFLNFTRTPIDIAVKNNTMIIPITKAINTNGLLRSKIENAEKIADLVNAPLVVVKSLADIKHVKNAILKKTRG